MKEYKTNVKTYEEKYASGYGVHIPDGHIIRFYEHILKPRLMFRDDVNKSVFDYGCGNGTHLKYFMDKGFIPYGCDISKIAIGRCQKLMPEYHKNFFINPPKPYLKHIKNKFDLIFSNQVLYYLDDSDIKSVVSKFYDMVKDNGIFYASMIPSSSYYYNYVKSVNNGMSEVVLEGRLNETTWINFKEKDDLEELFKPFKKHSIGFVRYETIEGEPADHYCYIGVKED